MLSKILDFRNSCAENGIELTPAQAEKLYEAYMALKDTVIEAVEKYPNFYRDLCNRTTEEKLDDLKDMTKAGKPMTLTEYNDLQNTIKKICEIEGYGY